MAVKEGLQGIRQAYRLKSLNWIILLLLSLTAEQLSFSLSTSTPLYSLLVPSAPIAHLMGWLCHSDRYVIHKKRFKKCIPHKLCRVQIQAFLFTKFSFFFSYFRLSRSNYSPQHLTLDYPQFIFYICDEESS